METIVQCPINNEKPNFAPSTPPVSPPIKVSVNIQSDLKLFVIKH